MIIIRPTDFRNQQRKYFEMAESEHVAVKCGNKLIHLIVSDSDITDEDLMRGIAGSELKNRVFKHIDTLFEQ